MAGSISLLVDSPLQDLARAMREVPAETRKQIGIATKRSAEPIWFGELRERAATRLQQRALVNSARVGVTARNVFLRSGAVGKLSSGTPVSIVARGAEFGVGPDKRISSHSKKGKVYTRRMGTAFPPARRGGYVVWPAAGDAIPRFASLWIQTAHRTLHEAQEKV